MKKNTGYAPTSPVSNGVLKQRPCIPNEFVKH